MRFGGTVFNFHLKGNYVYSTRRLNIGIANPSKLPSNDPKVRVWKALGAPPMFCAQTSGHEKTFKATPMAPSPANQRASKSKVKHSHLRIRRAAIGDGFAKHTGSWEEGR